VTDAALVWALAAAALLYPAGVARSADRGRWPPHRLAAWFGGLAAATAGLLIGGGFTGHAAGHLLLGMVAPLLLVLAAPVTLALRALPAARARLLTAVLRSGPARVLTHPAVAAVLDVGGLWLLYTTDLYALAARHPAVHLAVQAHVLLAGYLFTAAIVGVDPAPDRPRPAVRAAVLVLAAAAHAVLAKHLYASPPAGAGSADTGAMLMYYGGDAVEVVLAVLLCREWLAAATRPDRSLVRGGRRARGPEDGEVGEGEEDADDHEQPDAADGGERRERRRDDGQHDEGQPEPARHRSGDCTHAAHAPIPPPGSGGHPSRSSAASTFPSHSTV
jgi:putative membrane protein